MQPVLDPITNDHIRKAARSLQDEFRGIFGVETIERFVSDSLARLTAARFSDFVPVLAHRFARQRLRALAQSEGKLAKTVPEVLFVCTHNAGRSQMAAGLLDKHAKGRVHIRSAGSDPSERINPAVVVALEEVGVDLSQEFPKPLTDEVVAAADVVVTMGCGDACPVYPGKRYEDWELTDPAGKDVEDVRAIRDEIDTRVRALLDGLLGPRAGNAPAS